VYARPVSRPEQQFPNRMATTLFERLRGRWWRAGCLVGIALPTIAAVVLLVDGGLYGRIVALPFRGSAVIEELEDGPVDYYDAALSDDADDPCEQRGGDFRTRSGVFCIVTGCENSGTTILSDLVQSAPNLYSGFECGVLLADAPRDFPNVQPFYDWIASPVASGNWGLDGAQRDDLTNSSACHADMFRRLRRYSPLFRSALTNASWIVDKTPGYVYKLAKVMDRSPGVPVLVTLKPREKQIESWLKRLGPDQRVAAENRFDAAMRGLDEAKSKYPGRILVVNETELMKSPDRVMTSVFRFLGLRWHEEYKTMRAFNAKADAVGRERSSPFQSNWDKTHGTGGGGDAAEGGRGDRGPD